MPHLSSLRPKVPLYLQFYQGVTQAPKSLPPLALLRNWRTAPSLPSHNCQILYVDLIKNFSCDCQVVPCQLICQPEVVQLPRIGTKIEGMVLSALCHTTVHCGKHCLKLYRLAFRKYWTDCIAAQGHVGNGGAGNKPTVDLEIKLPDYRNLVFL